MLLTWSISLLNWPLELQLTNLIQSRTRDKTIKGHTITEVVLKDKLETEVINSSNKKTRSRAMVKIEVLVAVASVEEATVMMVNEEVEVKEVAEMLKVVEEVKTINKVEKTSVKPLTQILRVTSQLKATMTQTNL
jgi:hypothetical protein